MWFGMTGSACARFQREIVRGRKEKNLGMVSGTMEIARQLLIQTPIRSMTRAVRRLAKALALIVLASPLERAQGLVNAKHLKRSEPRSMAAVVHAEGESNRGQRKDMATCDRARVDRHVLRG